MRCPICSNLVGGGRCSCTLQARTRGNLASGKVQADWDHRWVDTTTATQEFSTIRNSNFDIPPRRY